MSNRRTSMLQIVNDTFPHCVGQTLKFCSPVKEITAVSRQYSYPLQRMCVCVLFNCFFKKGARTVLSSQTIRYCQDGVQDLSGNSLVMETSASSADLVSEAGTLWSA